MVTSFRELAGSPVEQYTVDGFQARREFVIAWDDRDRFAAEVLGQGTEFSTEDRVSYPNKASVIAMRVRYEPLDPHSIDQQTMSLISEDLNSYSDSFARAIVDYETVGERDREDGPENSPGTHLTYRMLFASEVQPIASRGWRWEDDTTSPLAGDLELIKRIPITEHHLTWHQVVDPPWDVIRQMQGTVNQAEFLGCAPGTLLFEGADANKLYSAGFEEGPSAFTWLIRYLFRERAVKHGKQTYGWNHVYRERPAGWFRPKSEGEYLYDQSSFDLLFQPDG